jgi:hypothetical protein
MHVKYRIQKKHDFAYTRKRKKNNFTDRKKTPHKKSLLVGWCTNRKTKRRYFFAMFIFAHTTSSKICYISKNSSTNFRYFYFFFHVAQRPEMPNHTLRVVYDSFSLRVIYSKYIIWYHALWYLETKKVQNAEWAKFSRSRALDNDFSSSRTWEFAFLNSINQKNAEIIML